MRLFCSIILIKRTTILPKVLAYLSLLLFREERAGPGAPYELFETIQYLFLELLSAEIPDRKAVLKLEKQLPWFESSKNQIYIKTHVPYASMHWHS